MYPWELLDTFHPFLRLPPEIRNRIYEYALTLPDTSLDHLTPCKLAMYFTPGERCGYYDSISFWNDDLDRASNDRPARKDFNQLRFVSRKLYQETAGLEFKFNALCFDHLRPGQTLLEASFLGQAADFLEFLKHVPYLRNNVSQLREIRLDPFRMLSVIPFLKVEGRINDNHYDVSALRRMISYTQEESFDELAIIHDSPQALARLAQLCKENPMMRMDYHIGRFTMLGTTATIYQAVFYMAALRGKPLSSLAYPLTGASSSTLDALFEAARCFYRHLTGEETDSENPVNDFFPPNLRFMPNLRYDSRMGTLRARFQPEDEEGPDHELVKLVKEWMENGI